MAVQTWRWTGRRVWGAFLPPLLLVGCFALMRFARGDGPLTWLGVILGALTIGFMLIWWENFADSDGNATTRLSVFAWIVRILSYAMALLFAFTALVNLFT